MKYYFQLEGCKYTFDRNKIRKSYNYKVNFSFPILKLSDLFESTSVVKVTAYGCTAAIAVSETSFNVKTSPVCTLIFPKDYYFNACDGNEG